MGKYLIRKTLACALPLAGITLAGSIATSEPDTETTDATHSILNLDIQPLARVPSDRQMDTLSLQSAFSLPFERNTLCTAPLGNGAHIESISALFFNNEFAYELHGQAAARILHDRAFETPSDCTDVTLLDLSPFAQKTALSAALTQNDVITVSSFLPWNPPMPEEPEEPFNVPDFEPEPYSDPEPPAPTPPDPDDRQPQNPPMADDSTPETSPLQDAIENLLQAMEEQERLEAEQRAEAIESEYRALMDARAPYNGHYNIDAAFWDRVSNAILVIPATNEGNGHYNAKRVRMTFMDSADSMLIVGALNGDNTVSSYSTDIAPDFLWYTAFDQGFCFPYYATNEQIMDFAEMFNNAGIYNATDMNHANAAAGLLNCDLYGTSFVTPDIGGYMSRAVRGHPGLHEMEITVAAYLATSINIGDRNFFYNARGLPFNDIDAGHGAFMPDVFFSFLDAVEEFKITENITEATYARFTGITESPDPSNMLPVTFIEPATAIRTIGSLTFVMGDGADVNMPVDAFPETVSVYSPAGTQYDLPLRLEQTDVNKREVTAGFSVSAYLGEDVNGTWHIEAPPGYDMVEASLEHITADIYFENSVNRLIDYAIEWHGQNADLIAQIDSTPWQDVPQLATEETPPQDQQIRPVPRPLDFKL